MSAVIAVPEMMAEAATDVATIGSTVSAAHLTAAAPTVAVLPAAADEVSAGIAHLFSVHAQGYQGLAGQAAAFHEQFVQHMNASARSYGAAEATNVASLQPLTAIVGSSVSAIAALPGQLAFNLLTSINAALGALNMLASNLIAFFKTLYDIAYFIYILLYLVHILGYLLTQFGPLYVFGVPIWI